MRLQFEDTVKLPPPVRAAYLLRLLTACNGTVFRRVRTMSGACMRSAPRLQVLQFTKVTFGYSPDKILYRDVDFGVDLVRSCISALHLTRTLSG